MKIKIYLFLFGIVFLPLALFGQLTSFQAGPENGKYNICEGETIRLKTYSPFFEIGPNPVTVDWMNSPVPASEKNLIQPTFTPSGPGTYDFSVTMTDLTYNVTLKKEFRIVVAGKPLAKAGNDINLCVGTLIKLNAVETINSASIQWTHNGRGNLKDPFTLAPTYIPATGELGTIKLVLKAIGNATCGGESTDELLLNYYPVPSADITIQSPQKICSNKEYKLNAVVNGHTSFKWYVFPNDKRGNLKDINTLTPTYTPEISESGTVSIILESIGMGCSVFDTLEMKVSQTQVVSSSATGKISACPGELVNMFVTTAPGFTYLWNTGAITNGIMTSGKSTTQDFSVVATNQDGCKQIVDFTIQPKEAPIADFTVQIPPKVCSNETFNIKTSASGYNSFKWHIVPKDKKGILLNDNTLNPTYVPKKDEGGLVQIILETIGTECTSFDTLRLNISQLVVEPSHFEGQVIACEGENINMFVTTTPGCTFLWNTGAKTNSINVIAKNQNQPYSVLVTNPEGCTNTTTYNITSKPGPVVDVKLTTSEKLCSNKSFKIHASGSAFNSFKWYINPVENKGSLSETNTLTPTYTPGKNESGLVKIIFEAVGAECASFDTLSLNIEQMNVESSYPDGKVSACFNENVLLFVNPSADLNYLWNTGAKTNSIIVKVQNPSPIYSVDIFNKNGCTEKKTFTIATKSGPFAKIASQVPTTFCSNQVFKLNAVINNSNSFKWYVSPSEGKGNLSDINTLSPIYTPRKGESGIVQLILEAIGTECSTFDTLRLNIEPVNIDISHPGGKLLACNNENVSLFVSTTPGWTYLWNTGAKTNSIIVKAKNPTSSYSVEVTNLNGCKESINFTITTKTAPIADITTEPIPSLCNTQSIKINALANNYISYKWYVNPIENKGVLTESNTLNPTYTPIKNENGIVLIILEAIGTECTSFDTLKLNIEKINLESSHPGGDILACNDENINLFVTSSPGLKYLWSTGEKTNGIVVKAKSPSSNYSVEVTNTNGCKENINYTITTKPAPVADITTQSPPSICSNQSIKLNATASGFTSFKWYVSPQLNKGILSESNTLNPTYNPRKNETGDVMIILETIGNQCTIYDTLKLKISQIYSEISHPDGNVIACEGDLVTLSVTASPDYTYLWNNGNKTSFFTFKPPFGGSSYSVDITNKDGCKQTTNFNIIVLKRPKISLILGTENSIITVMPEKLANYKFFGKNKELLYNGPNNTFDYSNIAMLVDTIYVIAFSNDGCSSNLQNIYSDYVILPKLKMVDAFSPNNDGVNDLLMPGRRTQVIDRTSKVLYEGWSGWDGTYLGREMPQGTYFYLLYDQEGNIYYKGPVTLLRDNTKF